MCDPSTGGTKLGGLPQFKASLQYEGKTSLQTTTGKKKEGKKGAKEGDPQVQ